MRKKYQNPLIVAVTGGIGSGQTTVCSFLKKAGCKIINADMKAKEVIKRNRLLQRQLKETFGKEIFDASGRLNTARLAELAFKDELQTQKLNQLVHPMMVESLVEEMEQARFSGRYPIVVIDAALVYEISIEHMFDAVVVVNAPLTQRMARVREREGMSEKQFRARLDKQIPLQEKVQWADFVINNDSTPEVLEKRTQEVFKELMKLQRKAKK